VNHGIVARGLGRGKGKGRGGGEFNTLLGTKGRGTSLVGVGGEGERLVRYTMGYLLPGRLE